MNRQKLCCSCKGSPKTLSINLRWKRLCVASACVSFFCFRCLASRQAGSRRGEMGSRPAAVLMVLSRVLTSDQSSKPKLDPLTFFGSRSEDSTSVWLVVVVVSAFLPLVAYGREAEGRHILETSRLLRGCAKRLMSSGKYEKHRRELWLSGFRVRYVVEVGARPGFKLRLYKVSG